MVPVLYADVGFVGYLDQDHISKVPGNSSGTFCRVQLGSILADELTHCDYGFEVTSRPLAHFHIDDTGILEDRIIDKAHD